MYSKFLNTPEKAEVVESSVWRGERLREKTGLLFVLWGSKIKKNEEMRLLIGIGVSFI